MAILRPRTTPAALISPTARSTPFCQLVPETAPAPDSSAVSTSLMSCARAGRAARQMAAASAAPWSILMAFPPDLVGWRDVGRRGAAPQALGGGERAVELGAPVARPGEA